ncbi:AraC family transcriptional regulator [Mesobaculum littorinae]|uniref:AraC family transcriptional regulator n=1 Tax=Mesobaculum littorinae TaxID=2486419 RepID=A0A438AEX0_9RHOB|nr:AraC family transcriptional regulator [Mesobaculum littorinae]RVV97165.1 AraC family transcriptional regulator [Mesobaculum littorinae]
MDQDALSDVVRHLRPSGAIASGFQAGGDWALRFDDQQRRIKCYGVTRGSCLLTIDGMATPRRIQKGDCFILPRGRTFVLASDLSLTQTDAAKVFAQGADGSVQLNDGEGFSLVGCRFAVDAPHREALLEGIPPVIHLTRTPDQDSLISDIKQMIHESRSTRPGSRLMADHLAHMVLLHAFRAAVELHPEQAGWLAALGDPRLGPVVASMHGDPAHRWTLADLARLSGMSRSAFAAAFRARTGATPMAYLDRWRMVLAAEKLVSGTRVAAIAVETGYASESSFSVAFKRVTGLSPRAFVKAHKEPGS